MNDAMINGITDIDSDLIENYFAFKAQLAVKKRRERAARMRRMIGVAAACFAIVVSVSLWLFVPIENGEQTERSHSIQCEDLYIQYREISAMNRFELFTLEAKAGDLYSETDGIAYYRLKGSNSTEHLILRNTAGEYKLLEFRQCYYLEGDGEITLQYIFGSVFGVENAGQIEKIVFEKVKNRKGSIDRDVVVQEATASEYEIKQRILLILDALTYSADFDIPSVLPHDEVYLTGKMALSTQTERQITVYLQDGRRIEMRFFPYGNCVTLNGAAYVGISENDLQWLIDIANIDMEYHNWGIPDEAKGSIADPKE